MGGDIGIICQQISKWDFPFPVAAVVNDRDFDLLVLLHNFSSAVDLSFISPDIPAIDWGRRPPYSVSCVSYETPRLPYI